MAKTLRNGDAPVYRVRIVKTHPDGREFEDTYGTFTHPGTAKGQATFHLGRARWWRQRGWTTTAHIDALVLIPHTIETITEEPTE